MQPIYCHSFGSAYRGRMSLRDIVENMKTQAHRLYHLGVGKLLTRTQGMAQGAWFSF